MHPATGWEWQWEWQSDDVDVYVLFANYLLNIDITVDVLWPMSQWLVVVM